jgi:hypothetical protein
VRGRAPLALTVLAAVALLAPLVRAGGAPDDMRSVFFIAKSENKNRVYYGIRLDDACDPVGRAPVYAYWRMLEHGPFATEPLLSREVRAYGIVEESPLERDALGARTRVTLQALRSRPLVVESSGEGGRCNARATLPIAGVAATLTSVFVQLRWPWGVAYLLLSGRSLADGTPLRERVEP